MKRQPSYRLHKASGQAVVTLFGVDHYLGKHNTPESYARYSALLLEVQAGKFTPAKKAGTVAEAMALYVGHAESYYRQDGQPTKQVERVKRAVGILVSLHGSLPLAKLGRRQLTECQGWMVNQGWARPYCNLLIATLKTACKWLSKQEVLTLNQWLEIQLMEGLRFGRTKAPEPPPVLPVPEADLEATLPHLCPMVADMVALQLATGMRPGELVAMTPGQVDRSGPIWFYRPTSHKNKWRGQDRTVAIGPRGQAILGKYLEGRLPALHCFRPCEVTNRGTKGPGPYTVNGYQVRIRRACLKAGVEPWTPLQLRHNAATKAVQELGWDAARALLGHRTVSTTRIYSDSDKKTAMAAAEKIG